MDEETIWVQEFRVQGLLLRSCHSEASEKGPSIDLNNSMGLYRFRV